MVFNYYPGCTLKNKAAALDISARRAAEVLGIEMLELPEWQCCGGVYPMSKDETAPKLPSLRALNYANEHGGELLTLCSACHHTLKSVNYDMKSSPEIAEKAAAYSESEKVYRGETKVIHYLEVLRDRVGFEELRKKIIVPLDGTKIGAYYGCMLLRPSRIMEFDDPENPKIMENFIKALGGEPVIYPYRNECCGSYAAAGDGEICRKRCEDIVNSAKAHGAQMLITACPLCMYNLKKYGDLPVIYFTEILCKALGIEVAKNE